MALLPLTSVVVASPAPALASDPAIVASWSFEEAAGATVEDGTGTLDGTMTGASRVTDGHAGKAVRFDDATDRIAIPDAPSLRATPMTVTGWIRADAEAPPADGAVILEKGARACAGGAYALVVDEDWVALRFRDGLGSVRTISLHPDLRALIPTTWDGAWHHVAIQVAESTNGIAWVYLDGRIIARTLEYESGTIDHSGLDTTTLAVGGPAGAGCSDPSFEGDMDEVRVYDGAVSRDVLAAMEEPVATTVTIGDVPPLTVDTTGTIPVTIEPSPVGGWIRFSFEDADGVEHVLQAVSLYEGFPNRSVYSVGVTPEVGGSGILHVRHEALAPQVNSEAAVPVTIERWTPSVNVILGPAVAISNAPFEVAVRVAGSRNPATGLVELVEVVDGNEVPIGSGQLSSDLGSWLGFRTFELPSRPPGVYTFRAHYDGSTANKPATSSDYEIEVKPALVPGEIVVNGGALTTDNPIVTVDVPAVGAVGVQVNHTPDPATIGQPWTPQTQVWLTAPWFGDDADGLKTVYVRWSGHDNQYSDWKTATITLQRPASAKTVQIDGGAPITTDREVTVSVPAPAGADVTNMRVSNDQQAWTIAPYGAGLDWTLTSGDGVKQVWGSWQDGSGRWTSPIKGSVVLDTSAPSVASVSHRIAAGARVDRTAIPVALSWLASDTGSGVDRLHLQQRTDGGSWSTVSATLQGGGLTRALATGHTYQFRVRAVDRVGHAGTWREGTAFRLTAYQESSSRVRYSSSWKTGGSTSYWGGTARYATARGAAATMTVTGRGFAWIGSRGPSRGTAKIYVNGVLQATVSTSASSFQHKQVLYQLRWTTDATRTVRIVVQGTSGHPRVDLDAFVALR